MKTKFLIPVLAAIFAIGMSFTTVNLEADPNMDYVPTENGVKLIPEQNCGIGESICKVRFVDGGDDYEVFDDASLTNRKEGNGIVIKLY